MCVYRALCTTAHACICCEHELCRLCIHMIVYICKQECVCCVSRLGQGSVYIDQSAHSSGPVSAQEPVALQAASYIGASLFEGYCFCASWRVTTNMQESKFSYHVQEIRV